MKTVMLKPGRKGPFRRIVCDRKGTPLKTLRFHERVPVELSAADFSAMRRDIGGALIIVEPTGQPAEVKLVSEVRDPVTEQPAEGVVGGQHAKG